MGDKHLKRLKLGNISAPLLLIVLAMILIVIVFLVVLSTKWSDDKAITRIEITGNHYVKQQEIIDLISSYALHQPKKSIKLDSISNLVQSNNYILSANSSYGLNGELKINIVEREPISYIIDNSGYLQIVDKYSFIFADYSVPKNLDLPLIYLNNENYDKFCLKNTLEFISSLTSENNLFNNYILDFNIGNDSRVIRATDRLYNFDLLFSSKIDPKYQFNKLMQFIDNYTFTNVNQISYLDLRWGNKVLIGKKI